MNNLPFRAAIFDLDGTLLDSMYVWKRVDDLFFAARGLKTPEGYGHAIAGLSYRECALYTKKQFQLPESWEDIIAEWVAMAEQEYRENVRLKPHAKSYLDALKARGIKLAVATAMPPSLFTPCLDNNGVTDRFEVLLSTEDSGGGGKLSGKIYQLAAERLDVSPADCIVFEDVHEGVLGAKRAGMRVVCVHDAATKHFEETSALADRAIHSFAELLAEC